MKLIQAVTVGAGGAANISFTSIPQTYTDLVVLLSCRTDATNSYFVEQLYLRFNNDSNNNYAWRELGSDGASAFSGLNTSDNRIYCDFAPCATATSNTFSNSSIYITNYTAATFKPVSVDRVSENNNTTTYNGILTGVWNSNSAITSISIIPNQGFTLQQYTNAYLYGVTSATTAAKATGGTITSDGTYMYHTFTSSGTFTPTQSLTADYLVVAGGGGGGTGGQGNGAGGGAGGARCTVTATGGGGSLETPLSLTAQAYTVTIGAGGAGSTVNGGDGANGSQGSNSVFASITSTGGGYGGGFRTGGGGTGGSGGGGGQNGGTIEPGGAASPAGQGFAGGSTSASVGIGGSGGGGAGAVGGNCTSADGGVGGNGVITVISGSSTYYAGGGGGSTHSNGKKFAVGGLGGGGNGSYPSGTSSTSGTANTGGGGGGTGEFRSPAGSGGSGIVIVRYEI